MVFDSNAAVSLEMIPDGEHSVTFVAKTESGRRLVEARISILFNRMASLDLRIETTLSFAAIQAVIREAELYCRSHQISLIQTVAAPTDADALAALKRSGFETICETQGRLLPLSGAARLNLPSHDLEFLPITECDRDRLHQVVLRTYEYTQDCPRLDRVRVLKETFQERTMPHSEGFIVARCGKNVGCLLLDGASGDGERGSEIVYFGVVPEYRRKQYGRSLVTFGIRWAIDKESRRITANVDSANEPAVRIYDEFGFMIYDRRLVLHRDLTTIPQPDAGEQNPRPT